MQAEIDFAVCLIAVVGSFGFLPPTHSFLQSGIPVEATAVDTARLGGTTLAGAGD